MVSLVGNKLRLNGKSFFMLSSVWKNGNLIPIGKHPLNTVFFLSPKNAMSKIEQASDL